MSRSTCSSFWFCCWGIVRDPAAVEHYNIIVYESEQELTLFLLNPPHSGRMAIVAGAIDEKGRCTMYSREVLDTLIRAERLRQRVAKAEPSAAGAD